MLFSIFLTTLFYVRVLGSLVSLLIALLLALRFGFVFLGVLSLSFSFSFSISSSLSYTSFSFSFSLGSLTIVPLSIIFSLVSLSLVLFSFSLGPLGSSIPNFFILSRASLIVAKDLTHYYIGLGRSSISISSLVVLLVE